jgi:hypothetical protein
VAHPDIAKTAGKKASGPVFRLRCKGRETWKPLVPLSTVLRTSAPIFAVCLWTGKAGWKVEEILGEECCFDQPPVVERLAFDTSEPFKVF